MSTKKYEIHITMSPAHPENWWRWERLGKRTGWKTSKITDDPILGPGNRFYFTRYADTYKAAHAAIKVTTGHLNRHGDTWLIYRKKIERICFDWVKKP